MLGLKFVAKLYDVPPSDGVVTAFDSFGRDVYVGTDSGLLQYFTVASDDEGNIFTTHRKTEAATDRKKKVARLQRSTSCAILFVLCARRLMVFHAQTLTKLHDIANEIGCFTVSLRDAQWRPPRFRGTVAALITAKEGGMGGGATTGSKSAFTAASAASAASLASSATGGGSTSAGCAASVPSLHAAVEAAVTLGENIVHRVSAGQKSGKSIDVYEFYLDAAAGTGAPVSRLVQQLVLPETAVTVIEHNGVMCVGLQREYSMMSIANGVTQSVFPLQGRPPLLCLSETEGYLRLHNMIYAVSLKQMPSARDARIQFSHIPLSREPQSIAVKHPFLFAFSDAGCEVYSFYEKAVIEDVPVTECLFSTVSPLGEFLFAAGRNRIWMLQTNPLEAMLGDLIDRYKVDEAFDLLASKRDLLEPSTRVTLETELRVLAGFAHLYHCNPSHAMGHFNDHIDCREVLCHCSDLIPIRKTTTASTVRSDDASLSLSQLSLVSVGGDTAAATASAASSRSGPTSPAKAGGSRNDDEAVFWETWNVRHPGNQFSSNVEEQWTTCFLTYPDAEAPGRAAPAAAKKLPRDRLRVTPDGETCGLSAFLRSCWSQLKQELFVWLQVRLQGSSGGHRRAIEYALLVLLLQRQAPRAVWRFLQAEAALSCDDCEPLLAVDGRWLLWMMLLRRKGRIADADAVWAQHLDLKSRCRGLNQPNSTDEAELLHCADFVTSWIAERATGKNGGVWERDATSVTTADVQQMFIDDEHEIFAAVESQNPIYLNDVLREYPLCRQVRDRQGNTALHAAVAADPRPDVPMGAAPTVTPGASPDFSTKFAIVHMLVDAGFSLLTRNDLGMSATDVALRCCRDDAERDLSVGLLLATAEDVEAFSRPMSTGTGASEPVRCLGLAGVRGNGLYGTWCGRVSAQ